MIKKIIKTNRAPDIYAYYCKNQTEAYETVSLKHDIDMQSDSYGDIYGFSIVDELNDKIEIYFNMEFKHLEESKRSMIGECIYAALALVKRRIYMSMSDNKTITFGESKELDDMLTEHISSIITKVMDI